MAPRRLAWLLLCVALRAWADAPACPPPAAPPYGGTLIDAMAQMESADWLSVIEAFEHAGVSRMALFARLHHRRNGEPSVLKLKERYGERLILGTPKPFDEHDDLSRGFVERTARYLEDPRYRFVGELLFAHADKVHGARTAAGERYVAPEGANAAKLVAAAEERRVPVMLHWEVYDWPRDWPAFDALYARFPQAVFIWPHAGFASAEQVAMVLARHPNVVVTLSKKEQAEHGLTSEEKAEQLGGPVVDDCGRLLDEWRALFLRYPDRFLFATDAHKSFRWVRYREIVAQWRAILAQLPDPVAQAIAWRNAERLYDAHPPLH